jgi:glycine cleavage system regulatory protein
MMQLSEQFAGMVQVVLPAERESELRNALGHLETEDFKVSVIHAGESEREAAPSSQRILLEVVGQDRHGIVAAISQTLAGLGVNVVELATDCRNAPWSGDKVFQTNAVLEIPDESDLLLDRLREQIEEIAGDLMVEIKPEIS